MQHLLIDARSILPEAHGIGRYTENLLQGLSQIRGEWDRSFRISVLVHKPFALSEIFSSIQSRSGFLSPEAVFELPWILKKERVDLYLNPSFESFPILPCRYAQVVHDLNHLRFGGFLQIQYYEFLLKRSIQRADHLFTVSQTMRKDISDWSGRRIEEIGVLPNAFEMPQCESPETLAQELSRFSLLPDNYFLLVGNRKPHKGLLPLMDAYVGSSLHFPLAVTLSPEASPYDDSRIRYLSSVKHRQLNALMQGARALIFPTQYEGYGRPPVEAGLLGTPLIVSDIPVLREVLDGFSGEIEFLDPRNPELWISSLLRSQNTKKGSVVGAAPSPSDVAHKLIQTLR